MLQTPKCLTPDVPDLPSLPDTMRLKAFAPLHVTILCCDQLCRAAARAPDVQIRGTADTELDHFWL